MPGLPHDLRSGQDRGHGERLPRRPPAPPEFLSGGEIAKHISYYLYLFFGERGEVAGLDPTDPFGNFNPFFSLFRPTEIITRGGFAELVFRPRGDNGRWYAVGLLNIVDSGQADLKSSAATLHAGYLLRRNLRATAEVTWVLKGPAGRHARAGIGLITSF